MVLEMEPGRLVSHALVAAVVAATLAASAGKGRIASATRQPAVAAVVASQAVALAGRAVLRSLLSGSTDMRRAILSAVAVLLPFSAYAAAPQSYDMVATGPYQEPDGTIQPAGTCVGRVSWDGVTPYSPPSVTLNADPQQTAPCYSPVIAPVQQTIIPSGQFFERFTPAEQAAIWGDAVRTPAVGVGLQHGMASGQIDLADPVTKAWVDQLVTDGDITAAREAQVLTP